MIYLFIFDYHGLNDFIRLLVLILYYSVCNIRHVGTCILYIVHQPATKVFTPFLTKGLTT